MPFSRGFSLRAGAGLGSAVILATLMSAAVQACGQPQSAAPPSLLKPVGTVKSIHGSEVTLYTDTGTEVSVRIQDSTRIVRTAPGQTSLKDASPMTLQELQVGDRVLVRGTASGDGKTVLAASAVVMKQSDVAARQQQQREDWQKRGVGGLVKAVEPAGGTIRLSVSSFGGTNNVAVHISKSTIIRRYSPDSVKFDDARPESLEQIHAGDQLRARGTRNPDGTELEAEEIVSGAFRNVAGTVSSTDPRQNTISMMNLISKQAIQVKVTSDSQLRKLPAMFAQRIAMRLKAGNSAPAPGGGDPSANRPGTAAASPTEAGGPGGGPSEGRGFPGTGANGAGGPPDFQQMLGRLPEVTLADLHKGDAVIMVTTEGSGTSAPTVITLLSGVEPILMASPNSGRAATMLSPWNLGSSPAGDAATQ